MFDGSDRNGTPSGVTSSIFQQAEGTGGDIRISTGSLAVTNGALLSSATFAGKGDAGNIIVNARDSVVFSGVTSSGNSGGALSSVIFAQAGKGGNIQIRTGSLAITDKAALVSSSIGQGDSGNLTINARDSVTVTNGGGLLTLAIGQGNAGTVTISAGGAVSLGAGNISAGAVSVRDAFTALENRGLELEQLGFTPELLSTFLELFPPGVGSAGNINITAPSLRLDQGSVISTDSTSGDGGDIQLQVGELLLLRRGSTISTSAGTLDLGGNGGNIRINAGFVIGVRNENSDIKANAFTGNGGRVDITTQGIFGLQFRPRLTPFSDITASSQFGLSGAVFINTPDTDPSRGLVPLPLTLVDPSQQISQRC